MSFLYKKVIEGVKTKIIEKNEKHGVFGRDLEELLKIQKEEIPIIVQECINYLENNS